MSDSQQDTFNKLKLCPRLCHLIKWKDFNGYGFNLHAEKGKAGQYIGKVDDGSPAEAAFLYHGDRIIEVNGVNIGNENHQQVVQRIKAGGEETRLLVVDTETDIHFKSQKTVVRGEMPEVAYCKTPDNHEFATPIMNYNQTLETKQNAETGETTSQGVASGATLITNGLHEDLPAPPPELIENGHEPTVERVTVSEVKSEVKNSIENDAIYDIPDAVPVAMTDSGSIKSGSEKSESDKQETDSIKAESEKSESLKAESDKVESEKAESEKAESEKAESEKAESEKAELEKVESEKAELEKESGIVASAKSNIETLKAEANVLSNEVVGTTKAVPSFITKASLDDIDTPPSLPKSIQEAKDIDTSDPFSYVNVSAEEMRQKILSKKKIRKFKDMNLKEKHEILERL